MRIAVSLILVLVAAVATAALRDTHATPAMAVPLTVGLVMLAAWLIGRAFGGAGLPQISGYLLLGALAGPALFAQLPAAWIEATRAYLPLISREQLGELTFINDLAISMIAITAGGEIEIEWLRGQFARITWLTVAAIVVVGLMLTGVFAAAQPALGIFGDPAALSTIEVIVAATLLGFIAAGNSPSIAIAVINELRADGPLSRTTLAVTVCKDLLLIVLFATLVAVGKGLTGGEDVGLVAFSAKIGVHLVGSLAVGVLAGVVLAWVVSQLREHVVFVVIGACFLFALLGDQGIVLPGMADEAKLKPLLIALAAGLTMKNMLPERSGPLFHAIENLSLPVYCLFFAIAGAKLELSVFMGITAAVVFGVVAIRVVCVWAVIGMTGRWVGLDEAWRGKLWLCLLPQAGVTLALTAVLQEEFAGQPWCDAVVNLLLGLVAVHALLGPMAYRWALNAAGEAGRLKD